MCERGGVLAAAALVGLAAPAPVGGQEGRSVPQVAATRSATQSGAQDAPKVGCFRGRPLPDCRSFWIVEMQGFVPVAEGSRSVTRGGDVEVRRDTYEAGVEWNLGHMVNVGERWALGAELTAGSGNDDPLTGVRLRARRWLGESVSAETEVGVIRSNASDSSFPGVGGSTVGLRLNIRDQGAFFVRWDAVGLREQAFPGIDYFDPGGTVHGLSLGASAGSVPALVATGATGLVLAVLLGVLVATSD